MMSTTEAIERMKPYLDRLRFTAAANGDTINLIDSKGRKAATITLTDSRAEITGMYAGRANLLGSVAKREIAKLLA